MNTPRLLAVLAVIAAVTLSLSLSACNTISGMGQDLSAAGRAVTGSADKTKGAM